MQRTTEELSQIGGDKGDAVTKNSIWSSFDPGSEKGH